MANKQTLFQKLVSENPSQDAEEKASKRYSGKIRLLILIGTILSCSVFFSYHIDKRLHSSYDSSIISGSIWSDQTLKADFSFSIFKPLEKYNEEIESTKNSVLSVFTLDENAYKIAQNKVDDIIQSLPENIDPEVDYSHPQITSKSLEAYLKLKPNQQRIFKRKLQKTIHAFINKIYDSGFINISEDRLEKTEILVNIYPKKRKILKTIRVTDESTLNEKAKSHFLKEIQSSLVNLSMEIISDKLSPNLFISASLTENEKKVAAMSVPKTQGFVSKGEVIVKKGERVSENHLAKLQAYKRSRTMKSDENVYSVSSIIGSIGHMALIYTILIFYLFYIRKRIFYDNVQLSIISGILLTVSAISWASVEIHTSFPIEYLIFLPAFSMLAAIVFDSRTAFYVTVTISLMMAGIRGNDYITGTTMLFAGTLAAYTVKDIQNRTQMFQSIFFIFIGFVVSITSFGLERSIDLVLLLKQLSFALINSAISPIMTFGLLFVTERIANISTDLRIQEFDSLNHPLLKKMSEVAPGTYQHTIAVAMLTERCADAIGANPLLAKVGAYFHDIGKMAKAEYFTENQMDIGNKHDMLAPRKSAVTIKEHVTDGILLARQYKLPKRISKFIPMHHGTTLIKHFYAKAIEEIGKDAVTESDFRYPGPKPDSKETAILMICDSAEAISRIVVKNSKDFEKMIDKNIKDRLVDGQFDECDITMHELQVVKETLLKDLISRSHQRVQYKEIPKDPEKPSDDK